MFRLKEHFMKRFFTILFSLAALVLVCVFVSCNADSDPTSENATQENDGAGSNSGDGSGTEANGRIILHAQYPYIYVWESGSQFDNEQSKMNEEGNGWYRFEIESSSAMVIFKPNADNWNGQTDDLHATAGEWWYKDGSLYAYKPNSSSSSGGNSGENSESSGNNSSSGNENSEPWTSDIYLEIMMFSNDATNFNNGTFVKFDSNSAENFKKQLKELYKMNTFSTTALNYAVHKALVNLSEKESDLPDNLKSLNIITFTDGLDNASNLLSTTDTLENQIFNTPDRNYGAWIKEQIDTRTVANQKLNCYSVGVLGDVPDEILFQNTLKNITSSDKEPHISQDFDDIATTFSEIANSLVVEHHRYDFNLKIPADATSVRMVFDGVTEPLYSNLYFDGNISHSELEYKFSFINGFGIELTDKEVVGQIEYDEKSNKPTGNIIYKLNNIQFINIADTTKILDLLSNKDKCKQFTKTDNSTKWNRNTEYDVGKNYDHETEHFSTVIYLILDATRSLSDNIDKVRSAAIDFIDELSEKAKATASLQN